MNVEIIHLVFDGFNYFKDIPLAVHLAHPFSPWLMPCYDFSSSEASVDIVTFHGLERGKVLSNQMIGNWALVHSPVNHHLEEDHLNMPNQLEILHGKGR